MRIVAIDASALNGGSVSSVVEAAALAAEAVGGTVRRFRVYASSPTTRATSRPGSNARGFGPSIEAIVEEILDADGILLGIPSTANGVNAGTRALLRSVSSRFAGRCLDRGYHGRPTRLSPGRRVGLLIASPAPTALASAYAASLAPSAIVRRSFARGGVKLVGNVAFADRPGHPLVRDRALVRAADLGRAVVDELLGSGDAVPLPFGTAARRLAV